MLLYAVLLVIVAAVLWIRKRYAYWKERGIAYVEPSFPLGNLQNMGRKEHVSKVLQKCYQQLKGRGPMGGIFFFINPVAMIMDLDLIKNVLVKDFQHFHDRALYHNEKDDPLTGHLVALDGVRWKNLRAKLTPTFTSGKMKMMFPTIMAVADEFQKTLSREVVKSEELEIKDFIARFTTDVIGSCAFGLECNSLRDPNAEFRTIGRQVFAVRAGRMVKFFLATQFRNIARMLHVKVIDPDVSKFFLGAVKNTVEYREKNNIVRNDFMSLLIKLKNAESLEEGATNNNASGTLSLEELTAQAFVFFIAGFETSSTAMSFCLYELARNPELQEKTRKDVIETIHKHGSITYEAIKDMEMLDRCISESLRMYPPATTLTRLVTKPYKVPGTNVTLEKGSTVIVPLYAIQQDPEYFPNPERFDPDRFTPEQVAKRNPYSYMPFGEGPRICIGMRFGQMQARVGLAYLLKNFRFSLSSKTAVPLKIAAGGPVLSSEGGMWLRVEKFSKSAPGRWKPFSVRKETRQQPVTTMILYLVLLVIALLTFWIRKRYSYWKDRGVPFVKPIFPVGNLLGLGRKRHISSVMARHYAALKGSGRSFGGMFFYTKPAVIALELDFVKTVLVKDFQYFHDRSFYYNEKDDPLSAHLFAIDGTKWKNLRYKLAPTFSSGKMKMMFPTVTGVAVELSKLMTREAIKAEDIEMKDILARFTTDVIGTCAFGIECNSLFDPDVEFRRMGKKVFEFGFWMMLKIMVAQQFRSIARALHVSFFNKTETKFFYDVVKSTVEYRERNGVERNDFMSLLIKLKNAKPTASEGSTDEEVGNLTLQEIAAQAFVFFLAGFETSSTAMSYCLYELALNAEIQDKARKDVLDSIQRNGSISYDAVQDMPYLDQCINETLRKYPPISIISRMVSKPYRIPDSDITLEQGSTMVVPIYGIHHDPDYYPEPEKFDPERFASDALASRDPFCFIPFGAGPRLCIGMRFGMMQTRVGLAYLLKDFRFTLASKMPVPLKIAPGSAVLTSQGGLWLRVEKLT
ncbi:uncharacterized protein LOC128741078 [Sabethes cyaneus]|uniref:uncharacterized protein LOC128741078 n=1 Tax=Sabethes cyaneus TaxID=53552 RepID=UPI00237DE007|nr:uncharacterized protein LOC128741078 [Sabethes cyaneus]